MAIEGRDELRETVAEEQTEARQRPAMRLSLLEEMPPPAWRDRDAEEDREAARHG